MAHGMLSVLTNGLIHSPQWSVLLSDTLLSWVCHHRYCIVDNDKGTW